MDSAETSPLDTTPKFAAAVQISRPKSASKSGNFDSPVNQTKVAKLVLKPAAASTSNKFVNKPSSPEKRSGSQTSLNDSRLPNRNIKSAEDSRREPLAKRHQETVELERKTQRVEREKKALSPHQQQKAVVENANNKSTAMDEAARMEAREFMKRQREKRKLETKREVDKSFVIRQRLDELRKTTINVIAKKPRKKKSPKPLSPPKDFYSLKSLHMQEVKDLKLKPMSAKSEAKSQRSQVAHFGSSFVVLDDLNISPVRTQESLQSPVKMPQSPVTIGSPRKTSASSVRKPISPTTKPRSPVKKPMNPITPISPIKALSASNKSSTPLQHQNYQLPTRTETSQKPSRPSSSKENRKPYDDLKLKVPDVKLTMSAVNRAEIGTSSFHDFLQPKPKVPFWLQNTAVQPYPYNFIWAVRKKLDAYMSAEERKQRAAVEKSRLLNETPHIKRSTRVKGRKLPNFSIKHNDTIKLDLQRPTITDDSETNGQSAEQEMASEANTISEISSIQSDMALVKSKSQEKEPKQDDDDTTISESIFQSLRDEPFIGKHRESINSEFARSSFENRVMDIAPENVSPNTSDKRNKFLSSTMIPKLQKPEEQKAEQNDLDNNKLNQEKEGEYQMMLQAFNQSLSHVIEVNHMLSTVLSSRSSGASSQPSETVKNYTSSFENNDETETQKTSGDISEMIENLVQQSKPARPQAEPQSDNSSIKTFIEDSKSTKLKPEVDEAIEDPPIVFAEPAPEFSSSSTKLTTTTTAKIVQQKVSNERKEDAENTLNESNLLNMFESPSFNIVDNNASFGMLMEKSSTEIKSWERTLIERTRGQIAWLELQKQNFRKHGQFDKVSTIKKQQRAILLRLEKERSKLKESKSNSERSLVKVSEGSTSTVAKLDITYEVTANESEARENIERILKQREDKLTKRRAQVEHLVNWQRKLDKEEEKLKQMEKELLGDNIKKLSTSPRKKKIDEDFLNNSIVLVKSIDKSLKVLENIETTHDQETVEVSGAKLNKLWHRLTGVSEKLYEPMEIFHLNKQDLAQFYEEAKEAVLQSDLKMLLESTVQPEQSDTEKQSDRKKETEQTDDGSDVSTMNSIANIETEEEYAGSFPLETATVTTTENDDELQQIFANQMKVFIDPKPPSEAVINNESEKIATPAIDNDTFLMKNSADDLDKTTSSIDMDIEPDSLIKTASIQTEPLISIDISSVDIDGFIIPEVDNIQVTDMDQEDFPHFNDDQQIEDISFPNLELSTSDDAMLHTDDNNRNELSTITECTEYEQSQGSSDDEISSEIVSHASTGTTSERVNSEIEKRLISISDSLEEVNEAFNKVAIANRSPSSVTYSTDKDFIDSIKASSSESTEKSPSESESTKRSGSQMTTSTPKVLMPDIPGEHSGSKNESESEF